MRSIIASSLGTKLSAAKRRAPFEVGSLGSAPLIISAPEQPSIDTRVKSIVDVVETLEHGW